METIDKLNRELFAQDFVGELPYADMLGRYKGVALGYALLENAVAVLSDLRTDASYIYYGGFSRVLGMDRRGNEDRVSSIWEKEILRLIHPDDLRDKHLQELSFFHFIKRQPKRKRADYHLMSKLRMKSKMGNYIPVLHRMFYVSVPSNDTVWLALCLYSPLMFDLPAKCVVIDSATGQTSELLASESAQKILSAREKQVLRLIDKGMTSKEIAAVLLISINTVSRHRQEILCKLQVKNSIEACRVAKDLRLM